jgi:hypothetical protein
LRTGENTPDTKLRQIDQSSGRNVVLTRNIEVVDWEENVDDILEVIKTKCKRAYPADYFLLVNVRRTEGVLDFDRVIEEMKATRSPFLEVWIVAPMGSDDVKVVRVAPGALVIDLKVRAEPRAAVKQISFMKPEKRGTETECRDLGLVFLPNPERVKTHGAIPHFRHRLTFRF